MIIVLLADGFEEIEALAPVDILKRAGLEVKTVGMNGRVVCGSHNIPVICDLTPEEVRLADVSLAVFPGGMPGSLNLDKHPFTDEVISALNSKGARLAAICAAPLILGRRGLLAGKNATCYPGFESELVGAKISSESVVTDGNITTARGMGVAIAFAKELVSLAVGKEKADEISKAIMEPSDAESVSEEEKNGDDTALELESKFVEAVNLTVGCKTVSTALLQRNLSIGYGKALKFMDMMEELGIVGASNGSRPRSVIATPEEWKERLKNITVIDGDEAKKAVKKEKIDYSALAELMAETAERSFKNEYANYELPPIELLERGNEASQNDCQDEIQNYADKIVETLISFGITATISEVEKGPRIVRFSVVPAKGTKVSSIMNLLDDITLNLAVNGIRMEAPIPGRTAIGIEIPLRNPSPVKLRELIDSEEFRAMKSNVTVCMGKDVTGQSVFASVAKMPHAIIAGADGMGKSVWINSLILSILYKARPDEVKLILIDPKQTAFSMYADIPHLLFPVITDPKSAVGALKWAVEETERRYETLQKTGARNIDDYNAKVTEDPSVGNSISRVVIIIDELADLLITAKADAENLIIRIAQKGRAAGIHLIIGTGRTENNVLTGLIRANIPSKFSCKVASYHSSRLIFDASGAEKLLPNGDMLVCFANSVKPIRVQCPYVSEDEVKAVVNYIKKFGGETVSYDVKELCEVDVNYEEYNEDNVKNDENDCDGGYLSDEQFLSAVDIAVTNGKISTSLIQRKLSIGYGKAAKFIDIMENMGIISGPDGVKPRVALITRDEWLEKLSSL